MAHTGGRPYARLGRGQRRGRGRPQGGRAAAIRESRHSFKTSRVQNSEDASQSESTPSEASSHEQEGVNESQSGSDNEVSAPQQSYTALLRVLKAQRAQNEPPRKKRRLESESDKTSGDRIENGVGTADAPAQEEDNLAAVLLEEVEEGHDEVAEPTESDNEDDEQTVEDYFRKHFADVDERRLKTLIAAGKTRPTTGTVLDGVIRKNHIACDNKMYVLYPIRSFKDLRLKSRLQGSCTHLFKALANEQKDLLSEITSYQDIQYGHRTVQNSSALRDVTCIHALNHLFKTRDRVLRNNTKLSQASMNESLDLRDQGFTRPKILFIVPTKQACVRFVETITKISEPEQQENKSRFMEIFSHEDDDQWDSKTDDFRELFGGNHDEDFRIGLKFTRKTIKYFSGFYNSDIIIGSALGLMRTITTGGGGKDKKKGHDADFLSSIEIVVVDNAAAIQMQNFQHLEYVFSQLNQLPKDSHGCDFARVRNWYLDGNAKYLRQTILLTAHHTPELNSLFSNHTHNLAGLVKYTPGYTGAMLALPPSVSALTIPQTFLRFDSPSPQTDSDSRFKFFTTTILPSLLRRHHHTTKGVLIFIPTFADFVRLRNHLATAHEATSLSFGSVSEYTSVRDTARARSHFTTGRHSALLYSERAHHHFRYRIRGVRRIVFYGVPDNPVFWAEVIGFLGLQQDGAGMEMKDGSERGGGRKGVVRALFSKWDVMKLERIVGTERMEKLIGDRGGDTFEFV